MTNKAEFISTHELKTELMGLLKAVHPEKKWSKSTSLKDLVEFCHQQWPYQVERGELGLMEVLGKLHGRADLPQMSRITEIGHYCWRNQR